MSDVFLWSCPKCHVVLADDKPIHCPVCGTKNVEDGIDDWWRVGVL